MAPHAGRRKTAGRPRPLSAREPTPYGVAARGRGKLRTMTPILGRITRASFRGYRFDSSGRARGPSTGQTDGFLRLRQVRHRHLRHLLAHADAVVLAPV